MARPADHSDLLPGSLLGKYRIERLLGHGGMATVYLARVEDSGLEVALKVLRFRGESARPGGDVARFVREARLAGGIRHPHWVSVYETGYDARANLYYIAMERMHASLAQRLRAHGPLPEAEAIAVVEQIALALEKAFETQMVHRDIKPGNILYNAEGVCKLTDFGIAKSSRNEETQLTLREAVFGTPAYMSPEQATDARKVDARSDIYSLGTVFFELLAGERPYQGETPVQVLAQVITDQPPPDVRTKPRARHVRSDTAKLIMSMMAKDPAARPQTPAELLARIRRLKERKPYAPPPGDAEEPPYDDSTIMDRTDPPSDGANGPGEATEGAPAPLATGAWPGAGAKTEERVAVRTETGVVTRATQVVGGVQTQTVATRVARTGVVAHPPRPARARPAAKSSRTPAAWFAVAFALLAILAGVGAFLASREGGVFSGEVKAGKSDPQRTATLVFKNTYPFDVTVVPTGGEWTNRAKSFTVSQNETVGKKVPSGEKVLFCVSPSGDNDFYDKMDGEEPAPATGGTNIVTLQLQEKQTTASFAAGAQLVFTNPSQLPLWVAPTGEWARIKSGFEVPAGQSVTNAVRGGTTVSCNVWVAFSNEYKTNSTTAIAPVRGATKITLSAPERLAQASSGASLVLQNPQTDTWVVASLEGGATGEWTVQANGQQSVPIEAGKETRVSYWTSNPCYQEDSNHPATNMVIGLVSDSTNLSLQLTDKPLPRLTVANTGATDLTVTLEGEGIRTNFTLVTNCRQTVTNLPAETGIEFSWKPKDAGNGRWRGGRKTIRYARGARGDEQIRAEEGKAPRIAVYNVYDAWPMEVTVSRNGQDVETQRATADAPADFQLPGAGRYRVESHGVGNETRSIDKLGSENAYERHSEEFDLGWGERKTLSWSAKPTAKSIEENFELATPVNKAGLRGGIMEAFRCVEEWKGSTENDHGRDELVLQCERALSQAQTSARAVDRTADKLMDGTDRGFEDWKRTVGKTLDADGPWRHIVETTKKSRNWKEFLENY
ncbi:MAG: serine/threonine protein kinase [Kiritimatiellae bacterium]|nr:serine/threonine protein kinase [Kiritimatiellia bacterium]